MPFAREGYFLAVRDALSRKRRFTVLLGILRGGKFKARVALLPGYDAGRCGDVVTVAKALQF